MSQEQLELRLKLLVKDVRASLSRLADLDASRREIEDRIAELSK